MERLISHQCITERLHQIGLDEGLSWRQEGEEGPLLRVDESVVLATLDCTLARTVDASRLALKGQKSEVV